MPKDVCHVIHLTRRGDNARCDTRFLYMTLCCNDYCREVDLPLVMLEISSPEDMPHQAKFTSKIIAAEMCWDMHMNSYSVHALRHAGIINKTRLDSV